MKIFKYPLPAPSGDFIAIPIPKHACVLSVHAQGGVPYIWASVDPNAEIVKRRFAFVGTGWDVPDVQGFVGTVLLANDSLVFHLFDCGEE